MAIVFFTEGALDGSFTSRDCDISYETQQLLESLQQRGVQIGVVLRPPASSGVTFNEAVNSAKRFFDPKLTIFNDLSIEQRLSEAAAKAKAFRGRAIFVGKHNVERAVALKAGFDRVVPHPRLVSEILDEETLIYALVSRLNGNYTDERLHRLLKMPMVPVYFTRQAEAHAYVITSTRVAKSIANMGFDVSTLGEEDDPQSTDLYLVRDHNYAPDDGEQIRRTTELLAQERKACLVLGTEEGGLILALSPDVDIENIEFPMYDAHTRRLLPDATLLGQLAIHPDTAPSRPCLVLNPGATLTKREVEVLETLITPAKIESFHAPYVGLAPLVVGGKEYRISSRHIAHEQNRIVTSALLDQLQTIGGGFLKVRPDVFTLATEELSNVEAELPGVEADSIVIISAHLDSTANIKYFDKDPAPGGDDDGSGMAAVLAAAEAAVTLRREVGRFKRSLRFVLFNAEEGHILGSAEYAAKQAKCNAKIEGVFQMDMIGFEGGQKNVFEIHAGFDRCSATERCSLVLAQRVRDMADRVSKSLINPESPQIYPRNNRRDPAQGNSDHAPFQERGYAACMISEDHHPDPLPDPPPRCNPHYHKSSDQHICYKYAAEIARAVIAAAFLTAQG
jgi:leucyl aminopeptidase